MSEWQKAIRDKRKPVIFPGEEGFLMLRYTGKAKTPRAWPGPVTGIPYAFGGHLLEMPVDARDARLMTGPFRIMDDDSYRN